MARFELDVEAMLDPEKLADQAVREQHKDIDKYTQGKPLVTSRSASKIGRPQEMTVFSVAQILQGVPAYASPQEALGRYQALVESSFLLAREDTPLEEHIKKGLIPEDVKQSLSAIESAQKYLNGELDQPGAGGVTQDGQAGTGADPVVFTPGDVSYDLLKAHPNIPYITSNFKNPAEKGQIHPKVLWCCKFLADNGCLVWITSGLRPGAITSSGKRSHHASGRAVDIRPKGGSTNISGDPWNTKVYQLLDSLTGANRPAEVGGPYQYKGGAGTYWFTDGNHKDHIHIGYRG